MSGKDRCGCGRSWGGAAGEAEFAVRAGSRLLWVVVFGRGEGWGGLRVCPRVLGCLRVGPHARRRGRGSPAGAGVPAAVVEQGSDFA